MNSQWTLPCFSWVSSWLYNRFWAYFGNLVFGTWRWTTIFESYISRESNSWLKRNYGLKKLRWGLKIEWISNVLVCLWNFSNVISFCCDFSKLIPYILAVLRKMRFPEFLKIEKMKINGRNRFIFRLFGILWCEEYIVSDLNCLYFLLCSAPGPLLPISEGFPDTILKDTFF